MARRKPRVRRSSRGRRRRPATKNRTQHSRRTTIIIETRGRRPKRTVYEDSYEEEWPGGQTNGWKHHKKRRPKSLGM